MSKNCLPKLSDIGHLLGVWLMDFMNLQTRLNLTTHFLDHDPNAKGGLHFRDQIKVWDAIQQMQRVISDNGLSDQIDPILDSIRDDTWKHPTDD